MIFDFFPAFDEIDGARREHCHEHDAHRGRNTPYPIPITRLQDKQVKKCINR